MQKAIELVVNGLTLRGMEHVPDSAAEQPVPAAVIFHGFTGTHIEPHRMFVKLSRALEKAGIAAFRFDFSGSGNSDGDFEDMTASGEITEAKAILQHVRQDPRILSDQVSLIGLSMGGYVAGITAGDQPQDVHRLVLWAPAGNFGQLLEYGRQQLQIPDDVRVVDNEGNLVGLALYEDTQQIDGFERAKPYQGPVLIVHGTNDQAVPFWVAEHYQANVYGERATIHPIEGGDHTFNNTTWESDVIQTTVDFLSTR